MPAASDAVQGREVDVKPVRWGFAFVASWLIWLGGTALGLGIVEWTESMPAEAKELPEEWLEAAADAAEQEVAEVAAPSRLDEFLFILGRNLTVYVWLLAGLLSAGAITLLVLLANGVALGQTLGFAMASGMPTSAAVDLLFTHGVLELGTFCIAGAVGFQGLRLAFDGSERGWAVVKSMPWRTVLAFGVAALTAAAGVEAVVTADLAAAYEPKP